MGLINRIRYAFYNIRRGFKFYDSNDKLMSFQDWSSRFINSKRSPIIENVYKTFASEFSKLDFFVYREYIENEKIKYDQLEKDHLNEVLGLRTNPFLTANDFKYIMAYQYSKYGKAMAVINRDRNGNVQDIVPIDMNNYEFGHGYALENGEIILKARKKTTSKIELFLMKDILFLRENPNDIFNGDRSTLDDSTFTLTRIFDTQLNVLLNEMIQSGEIRGIVKVGSSSLGGLNQSLMGKEKKVSKQDEITERIKKANGGILVLDAGEEWQEIKAPFRTLSKDEQDNLIKYIYSFKGVNEKVINGTANEDEMEVYFNKIIAPFAEKFNEELNYKCLSKTARSQGKKIDCRRNPFEYISITKAMDSAYKGAMFTTKNEMRKMVFKFGPIDGGDVLQENLNFTVKEESNKNE